MSDINAPITSVTVYNDRAQITRTGTITLEPGEHVLTINDLPPFQRDSLRASGHGIQGTRIINIDVNNAYHVRPPEEELQKLQDELAELTRQWKLLQAQQEALEDRRKWLRLLGEQSKDFARGIAQGQMKAQDAADFFQFMTTQARQDAEAVLNLANATRQAQDAVQAKELEYQQRTGNLGSNRLAISVTVEQQAAGDFELEVSYTINGASWHPAYDVRVLPISDNSAPEQKQERSISLTYYGIVEQQTGEDWHDVELSLSTARPGKATIAPEVSPWYLSAYTPPPPPPPPAPLMRSRAVTSFVSTPPSPAGPIDWRATDDTGPSIAAGAAAIQEASIETARTEYSGTAVAFRITHGTDIPSDGSPHKTTISHDTFPCEFDYVSAPSIEELVHTRGTITNTSKQILLPGEAQIFMEGEYVGSTHLKQTVPDELFKVYLGIDDSIKVERKLSERNVDKGGNLLQGDIRRTTYGYKITVHNYSSETKKIVVRDHLPVSQHERIKVRVQSITPPPTERTKLEQLTWNFSLDPQSERTLEYHFTVEHPGELRIVGLPHD